jgi:hypothetical protein
VEKPVQHLFYRRFSWLLVFCPAFFFYIEQKCFTDFGIKLIKRFTV